MSRSVEQEIILVVDDEVQIQRALRVTLSSRGYKVLLASDGEEALDMIATENPDLVILDLNLPKKSGVEVCRELRTWSEVPIIVLSIKSLEADKVASLDAGADDYITKPFSVSEMLARIRSHLRRIKKKPTGDFKFVKDNLTVDLAARRVFLGESEVHLTKIEYSLLHYLVINSGRAITHRQLLSEVWGPEYETDTQTLRVHILNLRKKIDSDSIRTSFIITEPGVGYRFADPS